MSNGIPSDDNIALRVNTACFNVVSSGAAPAQADLASDEHSFLLFCLLFHNFQVQCNCSIEIRRSLASENIFFCLVFTNCLASQVSVFVILKFMSVLVAA